MDFEGTLTPSMEIENLISEECKGLVPHLWRSQTLAVLVSIVLAHLPVTLKRRNR